MLIGSQEGRMVVGGGGSPGTCWGKKGVVGSVRIPDIPSGGGS